MKQGIKIPILGTGIYDTFCYNKSVGNVLKNTKKYERNF